MKGESALPQGTQVYKPLTQAYRGLRPDKGVSVAGKGTKGENCRVIISAKHLSLLITFLRSFHGTNLAMYLGPDFLGNITVVYFGYFQTNSSEKFKYGVLN